MTAIFGLLGLLGIDQTEGSSVEQMRTMLGESRFFLTWAFYCSTLLAYRTTPREHNDTSFMNRHSKGGLVPFLYPRILAGHDPSWCLRIPWNPPRPHSRAWDMY